MQMLDLYGLGAAGWMIGVFWLVRRLWHIDRDTYQDLADLGGPWYVKYYQGRLARKMTFFIWFRSLRTIHPNLRTHVLLLRLVGIPLILLFFYSFLGLNQPLPSYVPQPAQSSTPHLTESWLASRQSGDEAFRRKKWMDAIKYYTAVLDAQPGEIRTLYWRARAYAKAANDAASLQDVLSLLAIQPDHFDAARHADNMLAKKADWPQIIAIWNQYLNRRPDDARALLERAGAFHHMGRNQEAFADLDKACQLDSQRACNLLNRKWR